MAGKVLALGLAPTAGAPVEPRDALEVTVPLGVVGDRYARRAGTFQGHPDQDVTLIEAEAAEEVGLAPLNLRRNVVTRGILLEELVGRSFRVGGALLHGMRPCLPCNYLERKLERPGLKAALRGGLRARVVHPGTIRVGDGIEPVAVRLDEDMRAVVESARLAFVATVTPAGLPNLSPKGTIRVLDDTRLAYLDLASPQTRKNLDASPWMEINVVDATSRRGYRFLGRAKAHRNDETHKLARERTFPGYDGEFVDTGAIVLTVERALPLISPGYGDVADEHEMRADWKRTRADLDAAFEAHVAKRGPFRL